MKAVKIFFGAVGLALVGFLAPAQAANVVCTDVSRNHMLVSDQYVSACMASGVGNIGQGNQANDAWLSTLAPGHGFTTIGDQSFTQSGISGSFSIDSSQWANFSDLFIGFKFGTGNKPDEWFVYAVNDTISSGNWSFVNVFNRGGGLSHVSLYGKGTPGNQVPEPGILALLALGLLAAGVVRRKA